MTREWLVAEALVRVYLDGRIMDEILFDAIVWTVEKRLSERAMPALTDQMCMDIDTQADASKRQKHPELRTSLESRAIADRAAWSNLESLRFLVRHDR